MGNKEEISDSLKTQVKELYVKDVGLIKNLVTLRQELFTLKQEQLCRLYT